METKQLTRKKVYGAVQRLLHWWIGTIVTALIALGWASKFMDPGPEKIHLVHVHVLLGYGLAWGMMMRLLWGIIGPEHARIKAFWFPRVWWQAMRSRSGHRDETFGHDPMAALAYLILYVILAISILTGLVLAGIQYDAGPFSGALFDDFTWHAVALSLHDIVLYLATGFIVAHIGGMIMHEFRSGHPVAQSMVSGYQYRTNETGREL